MTSLLCSEAVSAYISEVNLSIKDQEFKSTMLYMTVLTVVRYILTSLSNLTLTGGV
jgi:hypothetical protein